MELHYFVHGKFIASATVNLPQGAPSLWSWGFVCPECGELWARIVAGDGKRWQSRSAPCERHPTHHWRYPWDTPGALLTSSTFYRRKDLAVQDWALALELAPQVIIDREFALQLAFYEKEQHNEPSAR